jgi:DNA-binding transcriptional LysR family regulator
MSINVDLDRLKSFVAVGEELHFTRAAQNRLHVSQPWLSRSVKSLEQKLGVQLFERHSRHVELTPPGRRLLYGAARSFTISTGPFRRWCEIEKETGT